MNDEFDEIVCTAVERPIHSWGNVPFPLGYALRFICPVCHQEQEQICEERDIGNITVQCKCGKAFTVEVEGPSASSFSSERI
jgi:hypothetical protein